MAWRSRFNLDLHGDELFPRYLLESRPVGELQSFGGVLKLASFPGATGYSEGIMLEQSRVSWGSLQPGSWSRTYGGLWLGIDPALDVRRYTTRGQVIELRVGLHGYKLSDFEAVWLGSVRNLRWMGSFWQLEAIELPGGLNGRFTRQGTEAALFSGLSTTALAEPFDPTSMADELEVDDASDFRRSEDPTDRYCLLLTPTDGDPYFVLAENEGGNAFDTLTVGNQDTDSPLLDTYGITEDEDGDPVAVEGAVGDAVAECVYSHAHPLRIARRIITSSGTATGGNYGDNGKDDWFPKTWGLGVPGAYIDRDDSEFFTRFCQPSSGIQWTLLVTEPQPDARTFLEEWLRPGGFFLAQRQGKITARGIILPWTKITPGHATITDDDIEPGSVQYETWDSQSPVEYVDLYVESSDGTAIGFFITQPIHSLPARHERWRSLPAVFDSESEWGEEVGNRLYAWDTRVPERLKITCRGWRLAGLTIGDSVTVRSGHVPTPRGTTDAPAERRWLVVGGGPDWFRGNVVLELLTVPQTADEA